MLSEGESFKVYNVVIPYYMHNQPAIIESKQKELEKLDQFNAFQEVDMRTLNKDQLGKMIPSTWAVVWKGSDKDGKFKSRLCARGDKETVIDNLRTDAPTSSKACVRILLSVAASKGWKNL